MPNKVVTFTNTNTGNLISSFEITDAELSLFLTKVEAPRANNIKLFVYQSQAAGGTVATGQGVVIPYLALDKDILMTIADA